MSGHLFGRILEKMQVDLVFGSPEYSPFSPLTVEEYCGVVGIDPSLGSQIKTLLPKHGMELCRHQYCQIPLGLGRGCNEFLPVFRDAVVGMAPIVRRTLVDEDVDITHLFDNEINMGESKSVVHLHASLARKTVDGWTDQSKNSLPPFLVYNIHPLYYTTRLLLHIISFSIPL